MHTDRGTLEKMGPACGISRTRPRRVYTTWYQRALRRTLGHIRSVSGSGSVKGALPSTAMFLSSEDIVQNDAYGGGPRSFTGHPCPLLLALRKCSTLSKEERKKDTSPPKLDQRASLGNCWPVDRYTLKSSSQKE